METIDKLRETKETLHVKLLTVKEAAAATRLSKSKIYQLLDQGILHRVRLPGCIKVLISETEIRKFIEDGVKAGREVPVA